MQKADQLIEEANPVQLDLLVLPEMVFSGSYIHFHHYSNITPIMKDQFLNLIRLQFPLHRSNNPLPGAHKLRPINHMGQTHSRSPPMYRSSRLSRDYGLESTRTLQHRRQCLPNRRDNRHISQNIPLLHRRDMGIRRRHRFLQRHSRYAGNSLYGYLHGHQSAPLRGAVDSV